MAQSIIIVCKQKEKADEKIAALLAKEKIDLFDQTIIASEKQIGIEDVRAMQKSVFLKPFKNADKTVIIEARAGITVEAQNALLKLLEEPPEHTIIVLSVTSLEQLLPTVISRCTIVELEQHKAELTSGDRAELENMLSNFGSNSTGDKLKLAQDHGKTRDEALIFLEQLILLSREHMLENTSGTQHYTAIRRLQKTFALIQSTNVNPRFALENLFLSI